MNEHDDDFLYTLRADLPDDFARDLYARLQAMEQEPMQFNPTLNGHTTTYPQTRQRRTSPLIAFIAACAALVMCGLVLAFVPQNKDPFAQELPITLKDTVEITDQNVDSLQSIMTLGKGTAESVAWSPDGAMLAVAGSTGIHLHDANDLNAPTTLFNPAKIFTTQLRYSPDGTLLGGLSENTFYLWDVQTGEVRQAFEAVRHFVRFSGDSTRLALIAQTGDTLAFQIRDLASGEILKAVPLPALTYLAFPGTDANFKWLVYSQEDSNYLTIINLATDETFEVLTDKLRHAISDDGRWLLTATSVSNQSFSVYDLESPEPGSAIPFKHEDFRDYQPGVTNPLAFQFVPGSNDILVISPNGIQLIERDDNGLTTFRREFDWQNPNPLMNETRLIFSPDLQHFAVLDRGSQLEIWDWDATIDTKPTLQQRYTAYDPRYTRARFNPSGTELISLNESIYQAGIPRRWDLTLDTPTASPLLAADETWQYLTDAIYVDDERVAYLAQRDTSFSASIIKLTDGTILEEFNVSTSDRILDLDENGVVMTTTRNAIIRYPSDKDAQSLILQIPAPGFTRSDMMLPGPVTPDGRLLPTNVCEDYAPEQEGFMRQCIRGAVRIWDTRTGEIMAVLSQNASVGAFTSVFSPDSRFLVMQQCSELELTDFSGYDYYMCSKHELVVWDLSLIESPETPLEPVARLDTFEAGFMNSLAISPASTPDNLLLAGTNESYLNFWQIKPAVGEITPLRTITSAATHITFNPAGTLLAASGEGLIELWGTAEQ